jgi:hypothetical protein
MSTAAALHVRAAGMGDYEALCPPFDELDTVHAFNVEAERFHETSGFARSTSRLLLAA